jgi:potassium efflux system protein
MTTDLTLLDLTKASLIVAVTWVAASNSPGVLEFAILRSTSIHAGTRNAIATIVQYVIVAAGFFLSFNALRMDWTQFGWIAGGLSVGIGFGLQEVVANFVCGLILLFERPVRVGDVVTVEGDMGTVTKIHLRATTIINFDRGEVVLPNKTLITSKLVNWTLSSPLNRNTISVGVAYGSDTEKARRILLEVAADHPGVSDEPAPIAIFDEFADSALNITLRVFLPDRNNRETTLSELHTEINQRFAAAGIEIPFPQRDLNLRSGWPPAS